VHGAYAGLYENACSKFDLFYPETMKLHQFISGLLFDLHLNCGQKQQSTMLITTTSVSIVGERRRRFQPVDPSSIPCLCIMLCARPWSDSGCAIREDHLQRINFIKQSIDHSESEC